MLFSAKLGWLSGRERKKRSRTNFFLPASACGATAEEKSFPELARTFVPEECAIGVGLAGASWAEMLDFMFY